MGYWDKKSKLTSKIISKVWLNKKDYKFQDFEFKITKLKEGYWNPKEHDFIIEVYNYEKLVLKLKTEEKDEAVYKEERFIFNVTYFNPQTDNDCFSINHIIAVCSDYTIQDKNHKDKGNAEILKNQFIFRRKESFYSYVKVWTKGEINEDNFDKQLSYDFATDEYITYVRNIFGMKKIPRRKIKANFQGTINKIILLNKL